MIRTGRPTLALALSLLVPLVPLVFPRLAAGQSTLDRVLAFPVAIPGEQLQVDEGVLGAWHRIRKLGTTASLLHVTAHPDDEHSGMLVLASRGWGGRTALLSLNRGEAGANAVGPELFDALGLIRTRELILAGRYYGLDDLYFTTAVDYGYSKTIGEAFRSWDREAVLEEMVRIIRLNRPLVVVSRFHGSERDGHGHHHGVGVLTPEAVEAAADPNRFPDQISEEGLRPWSVLRIFRGGVREDEPHHVLLDASQYSPSLGTSYQRWGRIGISLQRSQTSGRVWMGGREHRYEWLGMSPPSAGGEPVSATFFSGLDTSLPGLHALVGEEASPSVATSLVELQALVARVIRRFDFRAPERSLPELVRGLDMIRSILTDSGNTPEARFHLMLKERQLEDAIVAVAGVRMRAELGESGSAVLVGGSEATVRLSVEDAVPNRVEVGSVRIEAASFGTLAEGVGDSTDFVVQVPPEAEFTGPYFGRDGPTQNHYRVLDDLDLHLPWRRVALSAVVTLHVDGVDIVRTLPVAGSIPRLPYGYVSRRVEVLPPLAITISPRVRVFPEDRAGAMDAAQFLVRVEANAAPVLAETALELPDGWTATPASHEHVFHRQGEVIESVFDVRPPAGWTGEAVIEAVVRGQEAASPPDGGEAMEADMGEAREYRTGYQIIDHQYLPLSRLRMPARTTIRSIPVAHLSGMQVGYVMGVGDEVPAGIEALGASVQLLDRADLTGGSLDEFDAVVVGTRAYAVRQDLVENNQRLLDYASGGGNVIVLYQTQEYVPADMAPYPALLPRGAQEVSEQDAPVQILEPDHPLMTTPNQIAQADFDGWIEQRGSKFFSEWDEAYTSLVETHDTGQDPQRGIWLVAEVGEGYFSYLSLALHRQLPYGVPGAYRILSNALSLGAAAP